MTTGDPDTNIQKVLVNATEEAAVEVETEIAGGVLGLESTKGEGEEVEVLSEVIVLRDGAGSFEEILCTLQMFIRLLSVLKVV